MDCPKTCFGTDLTQSPVVCEQWPNTRDVRMLSDILTSRVRVSADFISLL